MSQPYVIHIYVADGDPEGVRLVEKSNWTGKGIVFSRSDLASAREYGLPAPGVYVLVGDDLEGPHDQRVYIGQGEDVHRRLGDHIRDDAKEFWNETIVFVSSSGTLNRAHVVYLESKLVELAHAAKRASVANNNRPTLPSLSLADLAEADGFLHEMLAIYPLLGVTAFEKPVAAPTGNRRFYLKGPDTQAEGEDRSEGFVVFAGATGRIDEVPSFDQFKKGREQLIASGVLAPDGGVFRLVEDTLFRSPSAAAAVLLGRNANGREEWKDADGVTLKQRQIEQVEQ